MRKINDFAGATIVTTLVLIVTCVHARFNCGFGALMAFEQLSPPGTTSVLMSGSDLCLSVMSSSAGIHADLCLSVMSSSACIHAHTKSDAGSWQAQNRL
jgi:hypothetical protein